MFYAQEIGDLSKTIVAQPENRGAGLGATILTLLERGPLADIFGGKFMEVMVGWNGLQVEQRGAAGAQKFAGYRRMIIWREGLPEFYGTSAEQVARPSTPAKTKPNSKSPSGSEPEEVRYE